LFQLASFSALLEAFDVQFGIAGIDRANLADDARLRHQSGDGACT